MDTAIGFIGTGIMGKSMCGHLLKAGYTVRVYNRTREKALSLQDAGGIICNSVAEVARTSDLVFSIVGYPGDVREIYLGKDGILSTCKKGTILVDMTTSQPSLAKEIAEQAARIGCFSLDAPVSGGDIGARDAKLAIMVGGERKVFESVLPFFKLMGENIKLMGGPGTGQHTKMSNQILIAGTMIGVVESLLYAVKAGLSMDEVIDVIGSGAAASWSINNLGRRIARGDFDPGFMIKHFVKDMGIALEESRCMGISLPGLALAQQFYIAAVGLDWENLGTQGLYKVYARMNGMDT
ncbi:MAG TPA: NAD(P)-dependent oxidoreductase [Spirochaetia bacterium]|nr:NAD(P)-dependent oxidoreductase [Spirochaetia bacterium]